MGTELRLDVASLLAELVTCHEVSVTFKSHYTYIHAYTVSAAGIM